MLTTHTLALFLLSTSSTVLGSRYITPADAACGSLFLLLGSPIVQYSGPTYDATTSTVWNYFNCAHKAKCIVSPRSALHVQAAMQAIFRWEAPYAVRGGGHSAMLGWNSVDKGVLIEFSNMKDATYNATKDSITLQPGIHWEDAVRTLEPFGVAPVGGRIGDVGIGLLLGGGLSFLSPSHGFAADSYKELDVVLVDGQLVTATATNQYSDLFRSLKGGGNRFGIVTRYELYPVHTGTKDVKAWYGGTILYPNTSAIAVLEATARYVRKVKDPKASILVTFGNTIVNNTLSPVILLSAFYNGASLPSNVFGEFLSIPSSPSYPLGPLCYLEVSNAFGTGAGSERGSGSYYGGSALGTNSTTYIEAYRNWYAFVETHKSDLANSVLAFTPVLDPQILAGRARGGNIIDPPLGGYSAVQLAFQFPPGLEQIPERTEQDMYDTLYARIPSTPGLPLFLNEIGRKQNAFATYGRYEELKQTYAKYDPTRFNVRFTEGPVGL